jgi:hypothetical protein
MYELSLTGSALATLLLLAILGAMWACIRAILNHLHNRQDDAEFRDYCRNYVEREYASVEAIDSLVRRELGEMTQIMERTR